MASIQSWATFKATVAIAAIGLYVNTVCYRNARNRRFCRAVLLLQIVKNVDDHAERMPDTPVKIDKSAKKVISIGIFGTSQIVVFCHRHRRRRLRRCCRRRRSM